jgi:hypothetical protein
MLFELIQKFFKNNLGKEPKGEKPVTPPLDLLQ